MGYLGLDETTIKDDNLFQRLFWPSDHGGEADQLGKQGFWICLGVAVVSLLVMLMQGHWFLALLTFAFYALGGIGVREHDQPSAILVAVAYILNGVASAFSGIPPGILQLFATLLLLANIRGTWIAAKWAAHPDPDLMPQRFNTTFSDKLVDQMPARVWPKAKIPFFCIAVIYILLTVAGTVFIAVLGPARLKAAQNPTPTSQTIEVSPSR
ncbi:hypothetical protein [Granulicella tundricola]|uniref:Transmembrane protein n=1 Tax=Granulicella tundricola (strain ATCC BAA-1859 / DSM 23138 / MP5ACTX9) TaxID=1198114 RepID=E8WZ19_GRATM|nr:hypothetical protein [Granulicella tundricola]ADW69934.1 hypothetical protein AciX9_2911 [Granulicella tundricola MP5ACTX9]